MPEACGCSTEDEAEMMGYGHICAEHWEGPPTRAIWAAAKSIAEAQGVRLDDQDDDVRAAYFLDAQDALTAAHKAAAGAGGEQHG